MSENATVESLVHDAAYYQEILDAGGIGFWEYDHSSGTAVMSSRIVAMLGYAPGEVPGGADGWFSLVHPDDQPRVQRRQEAALAPENPLYDEQFRMRCMDGQWLWVHSRGRVVERDPAGRPLRTVGILSDITASKGLERSLTDFEERLRLVMETIADVFSLTDRLMERVFYVSPAYERIWGRPAAELYSNPESFLDSVHPADREGVLRQLITRAQGLSYDHQYRILRPDGSVCWIRSRGFPIAAPVGEVALYAGLSQDITEYKLAENEIRRLNADLEERVAQRTTELEAIALELRASEARVREQHAELELIYRNAPVGLAVFDRDLRCVRINERMAEINGLPAAEHLGRTLREVVPALADALEPILRQVIATGDEVHNLVLRGATAAQPGVERDWLAHYGPVCGNLGEIVGVACVVQEITGTTRGAGNDQHLFGSVDPAES